MRSYIFFLLFILPSIMFAQKLKIMTLNGNQIEVTILDESERKKVVSEQGGQVDESLRMPRTARSYRLAEGRVVVEFFDGQAAYISQSDLAQLHGVRFFKTDIDFLRHNITYRIDMSYEKGKKLALNGRRLEQFKPYVPHFNEFSLYQLPMGQLLYLNQQHGNGTATVFEDLKSVASINQDVQMIAYGDLDTAAAKFIAGDPLWDYNPQEFWVYSGEEKKVIKNHQLKLVKPKVYVDDFYGNLYHSENGYYVVITEFNQKDMRGVQGLRMGAGKVFKTLEDVAAAEKEFERKKDRVWKSEHFYRKISDQYGKEFPSKVDVMIDSMCSVLNIDRSMLTYDTTGIELVDEAVRWNHDRYWLFNSWFPGVLAFYGECYRRVKGGGRWVVRKEKSSADDREVLVPHLVLADGDDVFDSNNFYKSIMEGAIPLREVGDWDGSWRAYQRRQKEER